LQQPVVARIGRGSTDLHLLHQVTAFTPGWRRAIDSKPLRYKLRPFEVPRAPATIPLRFVRSLPQTLSTYPLCRFRLTLRPSSCDELQYESLQLRSRLRCDSTLARVFTNEQPSAQRRGPSRELGSTIAVQFPPRFCRGQITITEGSYLKFNSSRSS